MEELNGAPPTRQRAGLITIKARNVARQNSDSILKAHRSQLRVETSLPGKHVNNVGVGSFL
jgi:hypothetical protein